MARTLPDLLRERLDIVFVGINPSLYSVAQGHYFARRANRFWPAFSRSALSRNARAALGLVQLLPEHDKLLLDHGFGFTDAVKRATARADELSREEFLRAVPILAAKIERFAPRVACFHGVTSFRPLARALDPGSSAEPLGPQKLRIGRTLLYVVPNPSPANAHFTPADQTAWYDRLAAFLGAIGTAPLQPASAGTSAGSTDGTAAKR